LTKYESKYKILDLLHLGISAIEDFLGYYVNGIVIFFVMIIIAGEILSRKFLGISWPKVVDIASLSMLLITFAGVSLVQRDEDHMSIDLISKKLEGTRLEYISKFINYLIIFITASFMTVSAIIALEYSIRLNIATEAAHIKEWIGVLFVAIGFLVLDIRVLIQILELLITGKNKK